MKPVRAGDHVRLDYTCVLRDGTTFDSTRGRAPIEVRAGVGDMIPGLDALLTTMAEGQQATVMVPCANAYGPIDPTARQRVPRVVFPREAHLAPGVKIYLEGRDGVPARVTIVSLDQRWVVVDTNHPLAGMDLFFDIRVVGVN